MTGTDEYAPRSRSGSVVSTSYKGVTDQMSAEVPPQEIGDETTGLLTNKNEVSWRQEMWQTWCLAWPIIGTFMLQMGPGMINVLFLGRLPIKEALGAGTLATMYLNITGNTVAMGLATAMDTLCSQAYGSGQKEKLGVVLQRALMILWLISLPIGATWYFAEDLLLWVKQDPAVAHLSGKFCRESLIGMWAIFIYMCLQKYLQAQGIVKPAMYIAIFSNLATVFLNWFFIFFLDMGFSGAPLARACCQWMNVILLLGYMKVTGAGSETWGGWSRDAFKEWGGFLALAIPGLIMSCAEFWAFEIQTLFAGYFGTEYLSAQSVIIQIICVSGMAPMGVGVASSIRVGNYLGKGNAKDGKKAAVSALMIALIMTTVTSALAIGFRYQIPRIYTQFDDVVHVAADVILVVGGFLIFDGTQATASGILRGCGRQSVGAILNAVCYYGIGLPLGYYFGFKLDHKTRGLWEGMFIALIIVCSVMVYMTLNTDWEKQVRLAHERLGLKLPSNNEEITKSGEVVEDETHNN
eukprot:comp20707_c0_seq1/m.27002 comp20707_c0_seq1/g.27002  ORF comp20707_c0_seq1/g.27002 comp20707_c0_seq1/m.27002 type:complete len:522 (-) comp20707_c0_seq1:512-2077(-)